MNLRLASYRARGQAPRAGVIVGDSVVDVQGAAAALTSRYPTVSPFAASSDLHSYLMHGLDLRSLQPIAETELDSLPRDAVCARDEATLTTPIARPGKVIGIGLNVPGLVGRGVPELTEVPSSAPFWFFKASSAVIGPGEPIRHPGKSHTERLIPEPELGIVIGRPCGPGIATPRAENARPFIAGYTVCNDVSALDIEFDRGGPPFAFNLPWSKSYPTFSPIGPWLVVDDELDPSALEVRCLVNQEVVVRGHTSQLLWSPFELIEFFSATTLMEPGDVISCGNFPPVHVIKPGDVVSIEVQQIGTLTNPVVEGPSTSFRVPAAVTREVERYEVEKAQGARP